MEVKVSQNGYDADTCADNQLVFSSEWPLLKIAFTGEVTIQDPTVDNDIFTHNLNYYPAFMCFYGVTTDTSGNRNTNNSISIIDLNMFTIVTTNKLIWIAQPYMTGPIRVRYYIYHQDLLKEKEYPIIKSSSTSSKLFNDYKLKVSKDGKDINSTDPRDFSIHSDYRSPMIHKTGFGEGGGLEGTDITITHNLGYEPFFLIYIDGGSDSFTISPNYDSLFVVATKTTIRIASYPGLYRYAYIIFKDPIL